MYSGTIVSMWRVPKVSIDGCHQPSRIYQVLMGTENTWHLTMSIMTDNSNISIVDIGVGENMPTDAPEPWTMTMYVCLFIGGFWCGAMTFLMILVVNMYWEQMEGRQYRGGSHSHHAILGRMAQLHGKSID